MSEQPAQTSTGGIGFFGMLGILFIGLKLGGLITWSWWWVLAPLWSPLFLVCLVVLIAGLFTGFNK